MAFEPTEGVSLKTLRNRLISLGFNLRQREYAGRAFRTREDFQEGCIWCWWE